MQPIFLYFSDYDDGEFAISIGRDGGYVKTPDGNVVTSFNEKLVESIIYELQRYNEISFDDDSIIGEPIERITLYNLHCTQLDFWSGDKNLEAESICLSCDPLTKLSPGPEKVDQYHQWRSIIKLLDDSDHDFHKIQYYSKDKEEINRLVNHICSDFNNADASRKSVFISLLTMFESPILSWAFSFHDLSAEAFTTAFTETANFVFSLECLVEESSDDLNGQDQDFEKVRNEQKKKLFDEHLDVLVTCEKFLNLNLIKSETEKNISEGESKKLEFKSTFRFCLKKKSHQHFISDIIIKSVCAFLNTDSGGTLLIGVADDGEILGLENDNFKSDDDCQLFFKNKVTSNLGTEIIPFVDFVIKKIKGKSIAEVKMKKSTKPIYFKNVFYVRNGPSSDPLTLPDAVNYIKDHFD